MNKKDDLYKEVKHKNLFHRSEVLVLTVIACVIGIIMGYLIGFHTNKTKEQKYDYDLQEFIKNYQYIVDNNISDISSIELIKGALEGMLNKLEDNYSFVIDEEEKDNFNTKLKGEYEGVGLEIVTTTDNEIYIYSVFENSPAEKAGLKIGDQIVKVDDLDMKNITSTQIANYIRKSDKDTYNITILRDEKEQEVTLKREKVTITSVYSKIYEEENKKIGYIYLSIFSATSAKQFKTKLNEMEKEKIDSLIIDVRFNNGGHLTTAEDIISLFLDSKNVIYQTDKNGEKKKFYSKGSITKKYPIVVLQNSVSASASEMVAAALKEQYGATIVGENSFGKGTVQELITLSDGTEYKFTTKKWLTPKGNWINEVGVEVDEKVELQEEYYKNPTDENDNQLQKALEILKERE